MSHLRLRVIHVFDFECRSREDYKACKTFSFIKGWYHYQLTIGYAIKFNFHFIFVNFNVLLLIFHLLSGCECVGNWNFILYVNLQIVATAFFFIFRARLQSSGRARVGLTFAVCSCPLEFTVCPLHFIHKQQMKSVRIRTKFHYQFSSHL